MSEAPSEVLVRQGRPEDLERILEIERASFSFPYGPSVFLHYLYRGEGRILVAETQGEVIGYVIVDIRLNRMGLIVSIATDPEHRRKGVGSLLIVRALGSLRTIAKEVQLQVAVTNEAAQRFYMKHGFEIVSILRAYYPNGEDAFLMRRRLV